MIRFLRCIRSCKITLRRSTAPETESCERSSETSNVRSQSNCSWSQSNYSTDDQKLNDNAPGTSTWTPPSCSDETVRSSKLSGNVGDTHTTCWSGETSSCPSSDSDCIKGRNDHSRYHSKPSKRHYTSLSAIGNTSDESHYRDTSGMHCTRSNSLCDSSDIRTSSASTFCSGSNYSNYAYDQCQRPISEHWKKPKSVSHCKKSMYVQQREECSGCHEITSNESPLTSRTSSTATMSSRFCRKQPQLNRCDVCGDIGSSTTGSGCSQVWSVRDRTKNPELHDMCGCPSSHMYCHSRDYSVSVHMGSTDSSSSDRISCSASGSNKRSTMDRHPSRQASSRITRYQCSISPLGTVTKELINDTCDASSRSFSCRRTSSRHCSAGHRHHNMHRRSRAACEYRRLLDERVGNGLSNTSDIIEHSNEKKSGDDGQYDDVCRKLSAGESVRSRRDQSHIEPNGNNMKLSDTMAKTPRKGRRVACTVVEPSTYHGNCLASPNNTNYAHVRDQNTVNRESNSSGTADGITGRGIFKHVGSSKISRSSRKLQSGSLPVQKNTTMEAEECLRPSFEAEDTIDHRAGNDMSLESEEQVDFRSRLLSSSATEPSTTCTTNHLFKVQTLDGYYELRKLRLCRLIEGLSSYIVSNVMRENESTSDKADSVSSAVADSTSSGSQTHDAHHSGQRDVTTSNGVIAARFCRRCINRGCPERVLRFAAKLGGCRVGVSNSRNDVGTNQHGF